MNADPSDISSIQLPVVWVGLEEVPVRATNQLLAQVGGKDELLLVFGHVSPPVVLGTPEQQKAQLERIQFVPVNPIARVSMTRERLGQWVNVLQEQIEKYDSLFEEDSEDG